MDFCVVHTATVPEVVRPLRIRVRETCNVVQCSHDKGFYALQTSVLELHACKGVAVVDRGFRS